MNEKTPEPNLLDDIDFDMSLVEEAAEVDESKVCLNNAILPRIKPKQQMINFLTAVKMDEEFEFRFGGDVQQAKEYIHAMRVELSRLRDKARKLGKRNIQFRVVIVSIMKESAQIYPMRIVTMKRTQQPINTPVEIEANVLDALTTDEEK